MNLTTTIIGHSGGYRKMFSFGWVCLIYHATTTFCKRNYNYRNDALGKTVGQMVGAARSARQNIVEASSRAGTSKETELRLLDVAKGSLDELAGDYEAFLVDAGERPWSERDPNYQALRNLNLDPFDKSEDIDYEYADYTIRMRQRCATWLENEDPLIAARAILVAIRRATAFLKGQIQRTAEVFAQEGGFTERLSKARLEVRDAEADAAPKCPKCGKPMRKRVCHKGRNAGNEFWSCSAYPRCDGTRSATPRGEGF